MRKTLTGAGKVLAVSTFFVGLTLYLTNIGFGGKKAKHQNGYVATYIVSKLVNANDPVVVELQTRVVSETGNSRLTTYRLGKNEISELLSSDESTYEVEPNAVQYVGRAYSRNLWQSFHSAEFLRNHKQFVGTATQAALEAYRFRLEEEGGYVERWFAPETGPYPLKQIVYSGNGNYHITAAVNVQFRSVSADEVTLPEDRPVSFEKAKKQVELFAESGAGERAETLRSDIDTEERRRINKSGN